MHPSTPPVLTGDPVADARVAGVGGSGLLIIAGLLCALAAVVATEPPALPITGAGIAALILSFRARRRPERWMPEVSAAASSALLVTATWTAAEWAPSISVLFVGVGIYAAFFVRSSALVPLLVLSTAGQGLALAHGQDELAALTWVVTTVAVISTTALIRWLRQTIRTLMASLDDAATGVLNRRGLIERIEFELARSARSGRPLSLLVGDLDHFKALNDGLGHLAGDAALVHVAEVLEGCCRKTDAVGRLGGDEFVIVLPETDREGAHIQAGRAAAAVTAAFADDAIAITITFGAATVENGSSSVELTLDAADRELYAAKAGVRTPPARLSASAAA
jgi:diguanylate cyclase (GGDEF)-like protein